MKILITVFSFLMLSAFQVNAADAMSIDSIKTLISGKTVTATHLKKGFNFKVYFSADGKAIRHWKGDIQEGTYFFKGNLHCINVGGGDKCASLVPNGDGTYKRLKGGNENKHFISWKSFADGKKF